MSVQIFIAGLIVGHLTNTLTALFILIMSILYLNPSLMMNQNILQFITARFNLGLLKYLLIPTSNIQTISKISSDKNSVSPSSHLKPEATPEPQELEDIELRKDPVDTIIKINEAVIDTARIKTGVSGKNSSAYKVKELNTILRELGLKISGKTKDEKIQDLMAEIKREYPDIVLGSN